MEFEDGLVHAIEDDGAVEAVVGVAVLAVDEVVGHGVVAEVRDGLLASGGNGPPFDGALACGLAIGGEGLKCSEKVVGTGDGGDRILPIGLDQRRGLVRSADF